MEAQELRRSERDNRAAGEGRLDEQRRSRCLPISSPR